MRIFVTGGSGFIGSHLLPLLVSRGHEVLSLGRVAAAIGGYSTMQGNLYQPSSYVEQLQRFQPECAIHLAWGGLPNYSMDNCRRNLLAGIDLFDALGRAGCSSVFAAGTCWEYGKLAGAVKEIDKGVELGMFATFKVALHAIGQSCFQAYGSRLIWGRPFFIYGPGQRISSLIPSCYRSLSAGVAPTINNPLAVNDFVYVGDVAEAIRTLVESNEVSGIHNIGTGRPVAVWEVVNAISVGLGLPILYKDMPTSKSTGLWADPSRMAAFGWRSAMTLEAGIAKTIEIWKKEQN